MEYFIALVLLVAALMSFAKLALLPRRYLWILAAALAGIALVGDDTLARSSMVEIKSKMLSFAALRDWCILLVVQEFLVCVAAARLLSDVAAGGKVRRTGYFALLPSALLAPGVIYLKMLCFNYFLSYDFFTLTMVLALTVFWLAVGAGTLFRKLAADREALIERLLHFELLLLALGIFVPVAANARMVPDAGNELNWSQSLTFVGVFALAVALLTIFFHWYQKYKQRKIIHALHHPNT